MQVDDGQVQESGANPNEGELSLRQEIERNVAELRENQESAQESTSVEKPEVASAADSSAQIEKPSDASEASEAASASAEAPKSKAPQSWNAAERAHWEKIPAEVQAVITRREEEAHRGITTLGQDAAFGKKLRDVINPYLPIIRAEGGDEAGAVKDLLQTAYVLRTATPQQKTQLFQRLAGQYGVDLSAASQGAPEVNPEVEALRQELTNIRGYLASNERQQHQQVEVQAQNAIDAFAADPKNEFYDEVRPLMGQLLVSGRVQTMQEAYEQACWATPGVRSTLQQREQTAAETKRAAEAKAKADAKRRAAGSVNGSPGGNPAASASAANQNLDLRDELRQALRAATSS